MKKIVVIIASLILVFSLTACGSIVNTSTGEVDVTKFPEAASYDKFNWPEFGISEKIPCPTWSNRGEIRCDTDNYFGVEIGYSTKVNFDSYVKACYDAGFSENYFNNETVLGDLYAADNAEGYHISVIYRTKNVMSIEVFAPGTDAQ